MAEIFIGVDPGVGGAIATVWGSDPKAVVLDMPVYKVEKQRRDYNLARILQILKPLADAHNVRAAIERPGPAQGKGKLAIASLARCGGLFDMAFTACEISFVTVTPSEWKLDMGMRGKDKDFSIQMAVQLFPQMAEMLGRVKDHGRAEALLLAEWLRRER